MALDVVSPLSGSTWERGKKRGAGGVVGSVVEYDIEEKHARLMLCIRKKRMRER
jgi:hypothetical protein